MSPRSRNSRNRTPPPDIGGETQHQIVLFSASILGGAFIASVFLGGAARGGDRIGVGLTALLVFVGAAAVGVLAGFIFGMPRGRFADEAAGSTDDTANGIPAGARYIANTNLIRVSDWLTTIIVGLTLVNIDGALSGARSLATALRGPLGGTEYAGTVGLVMVLAGFVAGFVLMFFWVAVRGRILLEDTEHAADGIKDGSKGASVRPADKIAG